MATDQEDIKNKQLGEKLRNAREKLKFTQAQVAENTDMTVNYYAMIERGEVNLSLKQIRKLFNFLKLKPQALPL